MVGGKRITNSPVVGKVPLVDGSFFIRHGAAKNKHFSKSEIGIVVDSSSISRKEKSTTDISIFPGCLRKDYISVFIGFLSSVGD